MKILHTSDWHIGKKLMNRERLDEQREVLDEICALCEQNAVDLVLLAGDVFDTFLPQAEAEKLFYRTVRRLAGENRAVLVVSGNHDDGVRLAACAPLSEELGVYVVNTPATILPLTSTRPVRPVESGEGYVVFRNAADEKVYINLLPYPNEARFKEEKTEESFQEKMIRWLHRGQSAYRGDMPSILLSHIFVAGGTHSESERDIDLGGARAVDLDWLPDCDYIALGHLHKKQHFKYKNVWYCGSPLQYAFDEAGAKKCAILLETDTQKLLSVREIPLTKGKQLVRLKAESVENAAALLEQNPDAHVEMTLFLESPMSGEESRKLLSFKCLKSLLPQIKNACGTREFVSRRGLDKNKLFEEYYYSVYNVAPPTELKTLFLELSEGVEGGEA